jgi:hypothetical protein
MPYHASRTTRLALHDKVVVAREKRAIQYSETAIVNRDVSAYWMPRLRGA